MSRVVIAPDKLKGSATAVAAAEALAAGWRRVRPDDELLLRPMADGGDGTATVLAEVLPGSSWHQVSAQDALGNPRTARYLRQPGQPGPTAVIVLAEVCGIAGLDRLRPMAAHTVGLGIVVRAALAAGAARVIVAPAGSASTDGGLGGLIALGLVATVADGQGGETAFVPGVHRLADLVRADAAGLIPPPAGGVEVLVDATVVLTGPDGAAAVFGPQKGARAEQLTELDRGLRRLVEVLTAAGLPVSPDAPGAGAAGGAAFGLACWGARLVPGAAAIAELIGLPAALRGAELVLTAEGRFDRTSLTGKACGYVLQSARQCPVYVVAGSVEDAVASASTLSLTELAGSTDAAIAEPSRWLAEAAAVLAAEYTITAG